MYQNQPTKGFKTNTFEQLIIVRADQIDQFWNQLNLRETFVDPQVFPYKVEFDSESQTGKFESGELNIHHGPFLSVHGAIGEVNELYRDLKYFYGSYVISFRLVRPTRLEFYKEERGIRLKLTCFVRPWFESIWTLGNRLFWGFFNVLK